MLAPFEEDGKLTVGCVPAAFNGAASGAATGIALSWGGTLHVTLSLHQMY